MDFQSRRWVGFINAEQIGLRPDKTGQRHDDLFADRVDRRVCDLGKELLEIVVKLLVLRRQYGQRRIIAHGTCGFLALCRHWLQNELEIFLAVAKGLLHVEQAFPGFRPNFAFRQIGEEITRLFDPVPVWLGGR